MSVIFHLHNSRGAIHATDEDGETLAMIYPMTLGGERTYRLQWNASPLTGQKSGWHKSMDEAKAQVITAHVAQRLEQL